MFPNNEAHRVTIFSIIISPVGHMPCDNAPHLIPTVIECKKFVPSSMINLSVLAMQQAPNVDPQTLGIDRIVKRRHGT